MRQVKLRGFVSRVALVALLALAAAAVPSIARAAAPSGDSINETLKPVTRWQGQVYAMGTASDPSQCQSATADPVNLTCDHFQLHTDTPGEVQVVLTWQDLTPTETSDNADFDVIVCLNAPPAGPMLPPVDPTPADRCSGGTEVAFSNESDTFERVTFNAQANTTYEVRVLPFFVVASDYKGCASYTSAAAECPTEAGGMEVPVDTAAQAFATGCDPSTTTGEREADGNGELPLPATTSSTSQPSDHDANARFALQAEQENRDGRSRPKGKVSYKEHDKTHDDDLNFKSTRVTCTTFTDGTSTSTFRGRVELRGFGKLKKTKTEPERDVCFRAVGEDNRDRKSRTGNPDRFEIEFLTLDTHGTRDPSDDTCGAPVWTRSGNVEDGDIDYERQDAHDH
jgi:hypothetical protein